MDLTCHNEKNSQILFHGKLYFFYSFDIGDDVDIKSIQSQNLFHQNTKEKSNFFKSYHKPAILDLEKLQLSKQCISASLYNFGAIALRYVFEFSSPIEEIKNIINHKYDIAEHQSKKDAKIIFNNFKEYIRDARFFNLYNSYAVIQIDPQQLSPYDFKENYATEISSFLRFETENLSDHKKNEILNSAFGYYRGDLLIIDKNSALIYDNDYHDIIDLFEFANMRHMELQCFDRSLDRQLNFSYERQSYKIPFRSYIPIIGMFQYDPMEELAKLRVDISVISERLWSSIKFSDEPYYLEIYNILNQKLEFDAWQKSIDKKLEVISHILAIHEQKISIMRSDVLNLLILLLILIEALFAALHYFR